MYAQGEKACDICNKLIALNTLQRGHKRHRVSFHWPLHLFECLFMLTTKKTSNLCTNGDGDVPETSGFPWQWASNVQIVPIPRCRQLIAFIQFMTEVQSMLALISYILLSMGARVHGLYIGSGCPVLTPLDNGGRCFLCIAFPHWLRPFLEKDDRKGTQMRALIQ